MTKPTEIAPDNVTLFPGSGQGTLTTPAGEEVPVRTFERGEEVVLVVLVNLDEERECDSVEAAKLEYTSRRGLIKLRGEAVFEDPSLIRFHPDGDAEILQRRDFVRVDTPHPVTVESETTAGGACTPSMSVAAGCSWLTTRPCRWIRPSASPCRLSPPSFRSKVSPVSFASARTANGP